MKKYALPLIVFLVIAGFLAIGLRLDPREVPSPFIGKPAPPFTLPQLHKPHAKFAHRELAEEFHLVSLELRTGLSRAEALKNLSRRIDLEEVSSLVALLVQTEKFGTSIGQALRVHSDSMRVNRQLRAEELAAKIPVKILFPLVFFIFPSLLVVVIGPGAINIARTLLPKMGGH